MNHKNLLLSVLLAISSSVYAENMYANLGVGLLDTDKTDNVGVGPLFRVGYLFTERANSFGVEAEANPLMVDMKDSNHNGYGPGDRDMAVTLATYLVYNFQIPDTEFTLRPRAGIVFPNLGDNLYKDGSSFGYGLSAIYNFRKSLGIYGSYGSFGSGVNQYSAGIEFSF